MKICPVCKQANNDNPPVPLSDRHWVCLDPAVEIITPPARPSGYEFATVAGGKRKA